MVALRERLPNAFPLPERFTAIPRRVKAGLAKAAFLAERFYDERMGPSETKGRHVLGDDRYHHSVERYIDKVETDAKAAKVAAKIAAKLAAKEGKTRPKTHRKPDLNLMPSHYRHDGPVSVEHLVTTAQIAQETNKYLFTQPDTQLGLTPFTKRPPKNHRSSLSSRSRK